MTGSPALVLDCRGLRCPLPVIRLGQRISEVTVDEHVGVIADDPAAGPDIQAWCRMRGQEYAGQRPHEDGTPTYLVRRVL